MRRTTFTAALVASVLALAYGHQLSVAGSADPGSGGGKPGEVRK